MVKLVLVLIYQGQICPKISGKIRKIDKHKNHIMFHLLYVVQ
jgi:hypothetical protein